MFCQESWLKVREEELNQLILGSGENTPRTSTRKIRIILMCESREATSVESRNKNVECMQMSIPF